MPKLNQVIAIEKGVKTKTHASITAMYQKLEQTEQFNGIFRSYRPKDDEGDTRPEERKNVQITSVEIIAEVKETLADLFDVTATKDWGNTEAKADIVVNGETLIEGCPVSFMLFLEKQLTDIRTFISKMPILDPSQSWEMDETFGEYKAPSYETTSTKKIPQNHVVAEATENHPAQVQVYQTDEIVGYWRTQIYSGAMKRSERAEMMGRVEALMDAVKFAREEANGLKVENQQVGAKILDHIFG